MSGQDKSKSEGENIKSLTDFIEENQKILTAIGVFTALAVFWSNLKIKRISLFISFMCLAATIPLMVEIWRKFNSKKSSWLLIIFMNVFTPLVAYTIWYLLVDFRPYWKTQMFNLVFWPLAFGLWLLYKKFNLKEWWKRKFRSFDNKKFKQLLFLESTVIGGLLFIFAVMLFSDYVSNKINLWLDRVSTSYQIAEPMPSPSLTVAPSAATSPTPITSSSPSPTATLSPNISPTRSY